MFVAGLVIVGYCCYLLIVGYCCYLLIVGYCYMQARLLTANNQDCNQQPNNNKTTANSNLVYGGFNDFVFVAGLVIVGYYVDVCWCLLMFCLLMFVDVCCCFCCCYCWLLLAIIGYCWLLLLFRFIGYCGSSLL